jgi:hypothetical protein
VGHQEDIISASNTIVSVLAEDGIEPLVAMTAMTQLAAKIAFDSGKQNELTDEDNRARWMGGAMLAYDAASGGAVGLDEPRRHLSVVGGVGPSKQVRKTRRTNRMRRRRF